jgi:hypothetical protein
MGKGNKEQGERIPRGREHGVVASKEKSQELRRANLPCVGFSLSGDEGLAVPVVPHQITGGLGIECP